MILGSTQAIPSPSAETVAFIVEELRRLVAGSWYTVVFSSTTQTTAIHDSILY
jgi:hypothetical protein